MTTETELLRGLARGERVCVPLTWPPDRRAELMHLCAEQDTAALLPFFRSLIGVAGMSDTIAATILRAVQRIHTVHPTLPPGCDIYQSSLVTLREGGNCTAKTIVALALSRACGVECAVGYVRFKNEASDHVCPSWRINGRWVIGETLILGAQLGEAPSIAQERINGTRNGSTSR